MHDKQECCRVSKSKMAEPEQRRCDKVLKSQSSSKPRLAFSIDSILGRDKEGDHEAIKTARTHNTSGSTQCAETLVAPLSIPLDTTKVVQLPWLAYTRYSPPKLPRSRKRLKHSKRRSSGSPRVPFTTVQLMTLEEKYTESRYLSAPQVTELAARLKLPQHRIKIWFQNRRAREKRSQEEDSMGAANGKYSPMYQGGFDGLDHTTGCCLFHARGTNISINCDALDKCCSQYERLYRCANLDAFRYGTMRY